MLPAPRRPGRRSPVRTHVLAPLLALVLLAGLTACTGDGGGGPEADPDVAATTAGTARTVTEEDVVALLAGAGVTTYDAAGDAEPLVASAEDGVVRLTGWQVETMTRELNAGRGYSGRDLDELTGTTPPEPEPGATTLTPSDTVPLSVVLAAWASAAQTPAAEAARELMGEQDWAARARDLVYPNAVLALFVDDLATPADAATTPADAATTPADAATPAALAAPTYSLATRLVRPAGALLPARAGICSDLVNFLSGSLDSIVDALQVQVDGEGLGSVLASIWNTVVSVAASAAKIAIGAFTSALLGPVTKAITVVAVLSSAASLLNPWTVTQTVSPGDSLGPGTDAVVTAQVATAVDFSWPADVKDCASTLGGVELPDPGSAKGSEVTWTYQDPDLTTSLGEQDAVVGADDAARLRFSTLPQESEEGVPVVHTVLVKVDLERTQVEQLTKLVDSIVLGALPAPARAIVDALIGPLRAKAQAKLAELVSVAGPTTDIQTIRFEPDPEPVLQVPPPGEDCLAQAATAVPDGSWKGPIALRVTGKGLTGQAFSGGQGTLRMTVKDGKVVGGAWNVDWRSTGLGSEGGVQVALKLRGNVNGSVAGSAAQPVLKGAWAITGRAVLSLGGTVLPLAFDGTTTERMKVEDTACDEVSGTFVPSFNANAAGGTAFSGTARWTGSRVD